MTTIAEVKSAGDLSRLFFLLRGNMFTELGEPNFGPSYYRDVRKMKEEDGAELAPSSYINNQQRRVQN